MSDKGTETFQTIPDARDGRRFEAAVAAMKGLLACHGNYYTIKEVASIAVEAGDALLAELEATK